MIPKLVKLQNAGGVGNSGRIVEALPTSGIFYDLMLVCRDAGGVLLTEAEIEADVTNIRLRLNGELKIETTAAVLFDIFRYWNAWAGSYTIAGQIPIQFTRPHALTALERLAMAWGMQGVSGWAIEIDLAAVLAKLATIEIFAHVQDGVLPLGKHICIQKNERIFGSTGVHQVTDLDRNNSDRSVLVEHIGVGSGTIGSVTAKINQQDMVQDNDTDLNNIRLHLAGRTPQTGWYHLDYTILNDHLSILPLAQVNSLQYDINFLTQPDNFIIYREEVRGLKKA
ncbi:MAG: major capsid protein P2 [Phycisphaerae bacterium]|jgi:hypothetical protein